MRRAPTFIDKEARHHPVKRAEPSETSNKKKATSSSIHFANNPTQKITATYPASTKRSTTTKKPTSTKHTTTTTKAASNISSFSSSIPTSLPGATSLTSSFTSSTPTASITPAATSSASSAADTSDANPSSGLSGGAIGGIIAAVIIALIGAFAALFFARRKRSKQRAALTSASDPFTVGFSNDHPPMQQQTIQSHPQQYQPQLQPQLQPLAPPPAPAPATDEQPGLGVHAVVATYSPTLSDEIDIQVGDQVQVLVEYDDGWCQGINLSRGHAKGVFPKHCLDYSADSGVKRMSSMRGSPS